MEHDEQVREWFRAAADDVPGWSDGAANDIGRRSSSGPRAVLAAAVSITLLVGGSWWFVDRAGDVSDSSVAPSTGADVRDLATEVYASFSGTERQREALYVLDAYRMNGVIDACMDDRGFPEWDWSLLRHYSTPPDPLSGGLWFGAPLRPWRSEQLVAQQPALTAESFAERDATTGTRTYQLAVQDCSHATEASTGVDRDVPRARTALRLRYAWDAMIGAASREAADESDYYSCMDDAGIPVLVETGLPATELGEAVSTLDPDTADIPASADDPRVDRPAWQDFLAQEQTIVRADWACRGEVYEQHVDDLVPLIEAFAAEHAGEIDSARPEWRQVEVAATALGYHGQDGPLGV